MNKYLKILGATAILSSASFATQASSVGGVVWNPDHPNDFSGVTAVMHQDIDPLTGVLSGYGNITTLNGQPNSAFCPGCELTFNFGGYTPAGSVLLPSANTVIDYNGGFVDFYVDMSPDAPLNDHSVLTAANTGSEGGANALWLSVVGHPGISGFTFEGEVNSAFTRLTGFGDWDVTGGLAAPNLNTDTVPDGAGGFADITFGTTLNIQVTQTSADGAGNFQGDSVAVPEPASLGIFALSLLGMAGFARKRKTS